MGDDVAALVAEYFARGGKITKCPAGKCALPDGYFFKDVITADVESTRASNRPWVPVDHRVAAINGGRLSLVEAAQFIDDGCILEISYGETDS